MLYFLTTQHEGTKLLRTDGNYQIETLFMLEAQPRWGLFSPQYVCCARLEFTLSKSGHLPLHEGKMQPPPWSLGTRRDKQYSSLLGHSLRWGWNTAAEAYWCLIETIETNCCGEKAAICHASCSQGWRREGMGEHAWARMLQHYCPVSSPTASWCDAPI